MNEIFKDKGFWLLYKQLEDSNITKKKIHSYIDLLSYDFEIKNTPCKNGEIIKSVEFIFECPTTHYYLLLDVTFYEDSIDKFLYLGDKSVEKVFLLGWWDLARWHPFCIKLDELESLACYWQEVDSKWENDIPFLLLNDFVGITEQQDGDILRNREKQMFDKLNVYDQQLVSSIYKDGTTREEMLSADKYQWIKDAELGWIFESNEYCCYSIRNKEHIDSNCGTFPFKQWNDLIGEIRNKDRTAIATKTQETTCKQKNRMDFTEKFNSYSNSQLLGIIENPNDYQPEAVDTAKAIISSRQLTENELEIAKSELDAEKLEKARKEQNKKKLKDKFEVVGKSAFDYINPVQHELPSTSKTIKTISVLLGILFLVELYKEFRMINFAFTDPSSGWDLTIILPLFVLLIMATAPIFFWKKKKAGWILAGISLTYQAYSAIQMFFLFSRMKPTGLTIDIILPSAPPIYYLLVFLFLIGMIITISLKKIRVVYSISILTMILTITLTIFIIRLMICLVYLF